MDPEGASLGQQAAAADVSAASSSGAVSERRTSTAGAALALDVPTAAYGSAAAQEGDAGDGDAPCSSRPASPLNIHSLINRPFGDVTREICSGLQLRSTAQVAAEQLRYLVTHRDHDKEVLAAPQLMALLLQQVRDGPGLPSSGSCMYVMAQLARTPTGRAQLRAHGVLQPVVRFLSLPDAVSKANAEPATLLLQNLSADKPCRVAMLKAGCIELLLSLLEFNPLALKQQHPKVAAYITGTLLNMVCGDADSTAAKHLFVKAGGMDIGCQVLAAWGRYDCSPATLRLRLLLTDLGKLQQYAVKLHQTALDASLPSARTQHAAELAAAAAAAAGSQSCAGQLGSARGAVSLAGGLASGVAGVVPVQQQVGLGMLEVSPELMAMAGKGVVLGTPAMPASERLTVAVLEHGKANHDSTAAAGVEGEE